LRSDYDAFKIDQGVEGNSLTFTLMYIYNAQNWQTTLPKVSTDKFHNLAFRLQMAYRQNFYHTQIHAADVTQNLYHVLFECDLASMCGLNDLEVMWVLLSGAAHDMDHPGNNNLWEQKTRSKLAILYNDQSVLENHHAASFFFLMDNSQHDCDIFSELTKDEKMEARKMIVENILCTDMAKHGSIQSEMKAIAELPEADRKLDSDNKASVLKAVVHATDIGNPARKFGIAKQWARQVVKEFFDQGDRERASGFEISMLCDRHSVNFANS